MLCELQWLCLGLLILALCLVSTALGLYMCIVKFMNLKLLSSQADKSRVTP